MRARNLLSIVELGGYPDFTRLFHEYGYNTTVELSMRKALARLKKERMDVIFAEFNYQHAFRDRLSSLESLIAVVERDPSVNVVVFLEPEFSFKFKILQEKYAFFSALKLPVNESVVRGVLQQLAAV
jgi:hypothetical protein